MVEISPRGFRRFRILMTLLGLVTAGVIGIAVYGAMTEKPPASCSTP